MRWSGVAAFCVTAGMAGFAAAQGMGTLQQQATGARVDPAADLCAGRNTCRVTRELDAGHGPDGLPQKVVELRFGIADAVSPDATPEFPCRDDSGNPDGGSEWHLLVDGKPDRKLLTLCNDGYGASGVGEDAIEVAPNLFTHTQYGGSAWRWVVNRTFQLVPPRLLSVDNCSFHNVDPMSGTRSVVDVATATVRTAGLAGVAVDESDAMMGCPSLGERGTGGVQVVTSLAVPRPVLDGPMNPGDGIGSCGMRIAADGSAGDVFHGAAARPGTGAELRAVALDERTLVLQIHDPKAGMGGVGAKSWVGQPHVELYLRGTDANEAKPFAQIGVTLDGRVHKGVGTAPGVKVRAWNNYDEAERPVTRLRLEFDDDYPMLDGIAVVYSEADGGKQLRLTANTGIAKLQPLNPPAPVAVPTICAVRNGRLDIVGVPETLDGGQ